MERGDFTAPRCFSYGFDPSAAFDKFGNAFYGHIASPPDSLGATYVSRTPDLGANWDIHKKVSSASSGQDKPFMAVDNTGGNHDGRIYISWTDFSGAGSKIKFSYSADHGVTFTDEITLGSVFDQSETYFYSMPIDTPESGGESFVAVHGSMPAVAPNGDLYVIWMFINSEGVSQFYIRKSTDGGTNFDPEILVAPFTFQWSRWGKIEHVNFPSMAVDPSNGYVYVTYKDPQSQSVTTPRIKLVRSTNGGSSWSLPSIIGNLGEKGEVFPWIACDVYGKVAVTFIHRHNDNKIDCYVMESYDHGSTFRSPVKVSSESSNPSNSTWTHHYQGMVLDNVGNNYVVWTDYRKGNADPYFDKVNTPPAAPQNLTATAGGTYDPVELNWDANTEADLDEYRIYRASNYSSTPPASGYDLIATLNAYSGGDPVTSYIDEEVFAYPSSWWVHYKIRAVDLEGNHSSYSDIASYNAVLFRITVKNEEGKIIISDYSLNQNFPNPFNPSTTIRFGLPEEGQVEILVYSLNGQKIATLASGFMEAGFHQVEWNGKDARGNAVSSGIYIYQLKAGNQRIAKKMLLAK